MARCTSFQRRPKRHRSGVIYPCSRPFSALSQYAATTHFNGQFTIGFDGDRATGEGYCLAHHLLETEAGRTLIVMSIRYEDTYTKQDDAWLFAERRLIITWTDTRPSQA